MSAVIIPRLFCLSGSESFIKIFTPHFVLVSYWDGPRFWSLSLAGVGVPVQYFYRLAGLFFLTPFMQVIGWDFPQVDCLDWFSLAAYSGWWIAPFLVSLAWKLCGSFLPGSLVSSLSIGVLFAGVLCTTFLCRVWHSIERRQNRQTELIGPWKILSRSFHCY